MTALRDIVAYLLKNYPHKEELSNARLTKMVYLADWRAALKLGRQLTEIDWKFNNYGPYVHDVSDLAEDDPTFEKKYMLNFYGQPKELITLRTDYHPAIPNEEKEVLDHVISKTSPKMWDGFIQLVYSTYPIRTQPRYSALNLVKLAEDYRRNEPVSES
jgi:hypothetical protein